ncbi:hypothetical protein HYW40_01455, partial [Candidatus Curtissbacteria bacterium]|nr:hypothetical protein [Candidatus Curtissbacteria bacterium]
MSKSDLLFLLALAAIPIQLGRHFFFDFSYVLGIPIDYRALIIYASDIAVILYLMFFFWGDRAKLKSIFKSLKTFIAVVIVFNTYLLADSLLFSVSYEASLIFVAKTIMFSLFAVASAVTLSKKGLAAKSATLFKNLILIESAILMSQFFLQKSLGLSFLGERSFDTTTPSIAHADLFGNQLLRPYGTFPHPNVAAAF